MPFDSLSYAKEKKKEFLQLVLQAKLVYQDKVAIFMAGTPGAGKTEFSVVLNELFNQNLVMIDADYFRERFPGYNGRNSSEFQRGASFLVDTVFTYVIHHGYSFILDGTFSHVRAQQNIERVLKREYDVTIHLVYQHPKIAWQYVQKREKRCGRVVPKRVFIQTIIRSRENVSKIQKEFGDLVKVHVTFQNFNNQVYRTISNVDDINKILPSRYFEQELEEMLSDE